MVLILIVFVSILWTSRLKFDVMMLLLRFKSVFLKFLKCKRRGILYSEMKLVDIL